MIDETFPFGFNGIIATAKVVSLVVPSQVQVLFASRQETHCYIIPLGFYITTIDPFLAILAALDIETVRIWFQKLSAS